MEGRGLNPDVHRNEQTGRLEVWWSCVDPQALLLLMIGILLYLKDPKLWELWFIPCLWVMQDVYHQP